MRRMHPIAALKRLSGARWFHLFLLALYVLQGPIYAQSEPPTRDNAAVGWIRPEEVPERAEALREIGRAHV